MKEEIKKKWVDALRGGTYKQVFGALKSGDTFCALGVLCDQYIRERSDAKWGNVCLIDSGGASYVASLPPSIAAWAGLEARHPKLLDGTFIIDLNDRQKKNFNEIADLIERGL